MENESKSQRYKSLRYNTLLNSLALNIGLIFLDEAIKQFVSYNRRTFIYGTMYGPKDLDPINAWDSASIEVIDQVAEGLFTYDLAKLTSAIVPNLALKGEWNSTGTEFTCTLRKGVKFHDGTLFNAEAVKWNFDRLYSLIDQIQIAELYTFPDGTNIINETIVVDDYTVKFVLNGKFAPLKGLLCFSGSYILSPTSTPKEGLIDLETGKLVGTGPFNYDGYDPDIEVTFRTFDYYWRGRANIDRLIFSVITDSTSRHQALLDGVIDCVNNPSYSVLETLRNQPNITVVDAGSSTTISYLGMNNKKIPVEMRKAMSCALDYDYIINDLLSGEALRLKSPIPEGILYANSSFNVSVLNLAIARQTLIDSGLYGSLPAVDDDDTWEALAANNPIASYNYTYNIGNQMREDMLIVCQDNFAKIGVKVIDDRTTWSDLIYRGYEIGEHHRDMLELYFLGWIPDYNDPSNFINILFTNKIIASNIAQVDDPLIQEWMEEALVEINPRARERLYNKIQKRVVEDLFPWCLCYVPKNYIAYNSDFDDILPNKMGTLKFYRVSVKSRKYVNEFSSNQTYISQLSNLLNASKTDEIETVIRPELTKISETFQIFGSILESKKIVPRLDELEVIDEQSVEIYKKSKPHLDDSERESLKTEIAHLREKSRKFLADKLETDARKLYKRMGYQVDMFGKTINLSDEELNYLKSIGHRPANDTNRSIELDLFGYAEGVGSRCHIVGECKSGKKGISLKKVEKFLVKVGITARELIRRAEKDQEPKPKFEVVIISLGGFPDQRKLKKCFKNSWERTKKDLHLNLQLPHITTLNKQQFVDLLTQKKIIRKSDNFYEADK